MSNTIKESATASDLIQENRAAATNSIKSVKVGGDLPKDKPAGMTKGIKASEIGIEFAQDTTLKKVPLPHGSSRGGSRMNEAIDDKKDGASIKASTSEETINSLLEPEEAEVQSTGHSHSESYNDHAHPCSGANAMGCKSGFWVFGSCSCENCQTMGACKEAPNSDYGGGKYGPLAGNQAWKCNWEGANGCGKICIKTGTYDYQTKSFDPCD
eukprot:gnl/MRDRNA2_/MRDRNA2_191464_c0_seq1.p1 gnl/MRDRNA2_/MRDRNA2_191464_c0~~gnl/MRDRNA2_/MRDRNA2_191464_c0_seq1.p1  ORF type:complete len:212 (+),score=43.81 gnl/MRDRNA2_/MRDRNA2_191464_c0_seq1:126-761(+)